MQEIHVVENNLLQQKNADLSALSPLLKNDCTIAGKKQENGKLFSLHSCTFRSNEITKKNL